MIYTIGHTQTYLNAFEKNGGTLQKQGRDADYPGGAVWKTHDEAVRHAEKGYSVFGVMANWETDTGKSLDGDWNNLLIDADLVILE